MQRIYIYIYKQIIPSLRTYRRRKSLDRPGGAKYASDRIYGLWHPFKGDAEYSGEKGTTLAHTLNNTLWPPERISHYIRCPFYKISSLNPNMEHKKVKVKNFFEGNGA